MKSDCYPISPTCTPPPVTTTDSAVEKPAKKATYISQQTEAASSPESVHGQDKQQQPSALLSPSSSSGASFTEEEEHAPRKGLPNGSKKVNGDAKSQLQKSDHHASDSESSLNSPNQSQKTQNSKLPDNSAAAATDGLHSIRLKHLAAQRSRNRGEDYEQDYDKNGEPKQNGHPKQTSKDPAESSNAVDEESANEKLNGKLNGNDKDAVADSYFLPGKRRTRDLKEENRLTDEEGEKRHNESDEFAKEAEQEKDELKDEEEELFKQQFRNHFKKRHLIGVAENGGKVSAWKGEPKNEPEVEKDGCDKEADKESDKESDKDESSADKQSDSPLDYSSSRPADTGNLYSIYKQFYENYFNQHLAYMNGDPNGDPKGDPRGDLKGELKSEPKSDHHDKSEPHKNGEAIDLKKRSDEPNAGHRPGLEAAFHDYPTNGRSFEPTSDSVLSNSLETKYSANLANHETLATLEGLQSGSRLKNALYTHKLPESMDTIANYLNYYNLNGGGAVGAGFDGLNKSNGFAKQSAEFDAYRKHYDSLIAGQLKNGLDGQALKGESTSKPGGLLSSALNATNLSTKLMIPDGQLLSKSLSRSLNGEKLNGGGLMTGSLNGSLHSSPTSSLFSQASPPINFLNYPRPPGQAMKPNSYHQFLCNLHQQQSTKAQAQAAPDLSISNLSNTAAVGGALSNSRRKFSFMFFFQN